MITLALPEPEPQIKTLGPIHASFPAGGRLTCPRRNAGIRFPGI